MLDKIVDRELHLQEVRDNLRNITEEDAVLWNTSYPTKALKSAIEADIIENLNTFANGGFVFEDSVDKTALQAAFSRGLMQGLKLSLEKIDDIAKRELND